MDTSQFRLWTTDLHAVRDHPHYIAPSLQHWIQARDTYWLLVVNLQPTLVRAMRRVKPCLMAVPPHFPAVKTGSIWRSWGRLQESSLAMMEVLTWLDWPKPEDEGNLTESGWLSGPVSDNCSKRSRKDLLVFKLQLKIRIWLQNVLQAYQSRVALNAYVVSSELA